MTGALLLWTLASCSGSGAYEAAAPQDAVGAGLEEGVEKDEPRLVLIVSVDQLRRDRLDAGLPGGLGRLAREGRVFRDAALMHARTETCPGHVSIVTGRHPGPAGVPGNRFIDRERLRGVYCVADEGPRGVVLGSDGSATPEMGRSPDLIRVSAIGDWLKDRSASSRVYAVSAKDRAAVAMGGQRADAAYWLDRDGTGRMTTSRWYREALPEWVAHWTPDVLLAPVPAEWAHATGEPPNGIRPDDFVGEVTRWSRTSPHPVKPDGDTAKSVPAFAATPYLDARTLDFVRELIDEEQLGQRGDVDLLAVGLSGTDYIGHLYGPFSQESRDALIRLDADLGAFLDFVDERVGPGRTLVVLTADHGVLPLPEWLAGNGGTCPVGIGRVPTEPLGQGLHDLLDREFGKGSGRWFVAEGGTLVFDPARAAAQGVDVGVVIERAAAWLSTRPGVAHAWTRREIQDSAPGDAMATLYRNSTTPGLEPDIVIEPISGCLFSDWPAGTSHGSPHAYDRDVPVVFMGAGIRPGEVDGPAATVDIAPTLAAALGLSTPPGLDGRALPLGR